MLADALVASMHVLYPPLLAHVYVSLYFSRHDAIVLCKVLAVHSVTKVMLRWEKRRLCSISTIHAII